IAALYRRAARERAGPDRKCADSPSGSAQVARLSLGDEQRFGYVDRRPVRLLTDVEQTEQPQDSHELEVAEQLLREPVVQVREYQLGLAAQFAAHVDRPAHDRPLRVDLVDLGHVLEALAGMCRRVEQGPV